MGGVGGGIKMENYAVYFPQASSSTLNLRESLAWVIGKLTQVARLPVF